MNSKFCESMLEEACLSWFGELGFTILHGPEIAPGEKAAERSSYEDVILAGRLRDALRKINPKVPKPALEEAFRKLTRQEFPSLIQNNHAFHKMLVNGVDVEYQGEGRIIHDKVQVVDFSEPGNNDWAAVNQFTITESGHNRRVDIILFINGLPLAVIELKNPADENATILDAFKQFQTYKHEIPSLFHYNGTLVVSDGTDARIGSLTADKEWFLPWRTIEGEELASPLKIKLEVLIRGVFDKSRMLDLFRYFTVFEIDEGKSAVKKIAGYHQFHAVNVAVESTVRACGFQKQDTIPFQTLQKVADPRQNPYGDRRAGVVWHTQGSGKSLTMAFYAGRIIQHPLMENPTVVVLTDRNDLDDQLFGTFSRCHELLRQKPVQADDRAHLHELLQVASGGVVFTTIQKFLPEQKGGSFPMLSDRYNIVVIADEAHRSQYDFIDGFARHMRDALPHASFIGFTGTPIELTDKNTRAVFGNYISVYDIQRAVEDGATVPIYYESRLAKLELDERERPHIDPEFEEITEGEETEKKEKLKSKWAALEAVVGAEKRVRVIAQDLVNHYEQRLDAMEGKAMIVCMSRRICVDLYKAIVRLRPKWHSDDDKDGQIKIVMTGAAADPTGWQKHIRNKKRREELSKRFRNPKDKFRIVIVRDMWLTGFDAPSLHTMYLDKPMQGHGLMQAIARVNRVFKDKPGGLVVDYLGLADQLRRALASYAESGGKGNTAIDQNVAVDFMMEKYEVSCGMLHKFDWSLWTKGTAAQKLSLLPSAQEHILTLDDGSARFIKAVNDLSKAFALSVPHDKAIGIRDDVGFFQAVRAALIKTSTGGGMAEKDYEHAIRQLISKAIATDKVIDIFAAAGLKKPDISILSEEFLAEVRNMPQRNLAVELLRKLLNDELKTRSKRNLVQSRSFSEMLERSIRSYQNRAIETAQIIEELIKLAKDMREADKRGDELKLSDEEVAFYDALEINDSAVKVLGDETLRTIARELVKTIRKNVSIDWTVRDNVQAQLRVMVKRILRKYGYPPDKQEKATNTVLDQARLLCNEWVA
ncbi:MAG: type I restriction endonuclease subunit R [Victivallales bacterium]